MPVVRTVLALLVAASAVPAAELHTLSGKKVTGELVSAGDQAVEIRTDKGPVRTPLGQVMDVVLGPVKPPAPDAKRIDVELTDGTVLHAKPDGLTIKGGDVEVTLLTGQAIKFALKNVAYYLKDAQDPVLQNKFKEVLKRKKKNDRVLRLTVNERAKTPEAKYELNALDGTVGDADDKGERIAFRLAGVGDQKVRLDRLQGMVFYRPEALTVPTVCQVYDQAGNVLSANKVTGDASGFKVTTPAGVRFTLEPKSVARLDYNINKVRFLSDLEPDKVVERSASGLVVKYRKDTNLDGQPIRIRGTAYPRGLSMHAHTELEYNLNGKYKEFTAVVGVDDQIGGDSKARVTVECDDAKVFSEEITRKDVKNLTIKVKDVNTLRIVVTSRNLLDLHDHVTFANAKVSQ